MIDYLTEEGLQSVLTAMDELATTSDLDVSGMIANGVSAYRSKMHGTFRKPEYAAQNALSCSQIMAALRTRKPRESAPCPIHAECERYLPASMCTYRNGMITYDEAVQEAEERQDSYAHGDTSDGYRADND